MRVTTPLGDAAMAYNVTLQRFALDDVRIGLWVDGATWNAFNGAALGADGLFSEKGEFAAECLVAALSGVNIYSIPRVNAGGVSHAAWADVPGLEEVVLTVAKAGAAFVLRHVDTAALTREVLWLANDALDKTLSTYKDRCAEKRPSVTVAARIDARGKRPTEHAKAHGVHGVMKVTMEMLSVCLVLLSMILAFFLIWAKRKTRPVRLAASHRMRSRVAVDGSRATTGVPPSGVSRRVPRARSAATGARSGARPGPSLRNRHPRAPRRRRRPTR